LIEERVVRRSEVGGQEVGGRKLEVGSFSVNPKIQHLE
jgi:hypothetical protein